jgi:phosphohistidine phosphatase
MADSHSLYVIRHAIAAERGAEYPDDTRRPLTDDGISRFRKVVAGLEELEVEVQIVLTSPLLRARQTADLLSKGLRGHPSVVETRALSPGATDKDLMTELRRYARRSSIALVGHEPHLGEAAARLVGCAGRFDFRKGGVCRIDVEDLPPSGPGRLQWFASPKILVRMTGSR